MMVVVAFALLSFLTNVGAFTTIPVVNNVGRMMTALDSSSNPNNNMKEQEKLLRQELVEKNSAIQNERQYGLAEAEGMGGAFSGSDESVSQPQKSRQSSLQSKMERMTKPRAYPLFLAEKAAEFLESQAGEFVKWTQETGLDVGTEQMSMDKKKEKIVVLGTGWGAASFLKDVDTSQFDITVISPRNYFLFTPMLAGASVGTVEYRSITEPVREINRNAKFLEAIATSIDPETSTVSCESVVCAGNSCEIDDFDITYDRLIVTVGAQTNTFGIPGVREYCCFLKQVEDARRIRTAIVNCFERANLPSLTDKERQDNLTFAVIGAGPTGVEFAAELRDFVEQDGPKYYPHLLKHVRIKVIEATNTILAPFDKSLQDEAIAQLRRKVSIADPETRDLLPENFQLTELLLETPVAEVKERSILLKDGTELNYGLAVWAAGNGPLPLTLQLINALGDEQGKQQDVARGRLAVDPWLRVQGSKGKIMALGDCSCITNSQLPATAQVASQQGEYLASLFNKQYDFSPLQQEQASNDDDNVLLPPPKRNPSATPSLSESIAEFASQGGDYAKPFQFLNLGILAYTGAGSALAQVSLAPGGENIRGKGQLGNAVWRSVYLSKQVSWRNRFLVLNDWTKRQVFGRDITRI